MTMEGAASPGTTHDPPFDPPEALWQLAVVIDEAAIMLESSDLSTRPSTHVACTRQRYHGRHCPPVCVKREPASW